MSSVSTDTNRFIAPKVVAMDASGAADYTYVQQETVLISGIHYEFDVTLNAANTKKLLEAFTVSGKGVDGNLSVSVTNSADLKDVLQGAINGGFAAQIGGAGNTATAQLIADLHAGLSAEIGADGLINTVQNLDVTNVDVTINSSQGADDMIAALDASACKLIYTQIPENGLEVYMDASSEEKTTSALPLSGGDVLTFVFDINVSDVEPAKTQTDITGAGFGSAVAGAYSSNLHYNLDTKRCAFNLTMAGTGKITGLKA